MVAYEEYDKHRLFNATIFAWVHPNDPATVLQNFTNTYTEEEDGPFTNVRRQWINERLEVIVKRLTTAAISIFEKWGITGPAGGAQKISSINWAFDILHAAFDKTPGCADADITLYKDIQKRLAGYKKQTKVLEERRDELRDNKKETDNEISKLDDKLDELRDNKKETDNEISKLNDKLDELSRIKERSDSETNELSNVRDELRKLVKKAGDLSDELRKTINQLERQIKMESGDLDQLSRLKEKCPGIEEYIKEK